MKRKSLQEITATRQGKGLVQQNLNKVLKNFRFSFGILKQLESFSDSLAIYSCSLLFFPKGRRTFSSKNFKLQPLSIKNLFIEKSSRCIWSLHSLLTFYYHCMFPLILARRMFPWFMGRRIHKKPYKNQLTKQTFVLERDLQTNPSSPSLHPRLRWFWTWKRFDEG